jgi:hypothetical protein
LEQSKSLRVGGRPPGTIKIFLFEIELETIIVVIDGELVPLTATELESDAFVGNAVDVPLEIEGEPEGVVAKDRIVVLARWDVSEIIEVE